jgi:hypothetical protein
MHTAGRSTVDDCQGRLHAAGWSAGGFATAPGWVVMGANSENAIRATGPTQSEAWRRAVGQARAAGMLGAHCRRGGYPLAGPGPGES